MLYYYSHPQKPKKKKKSYVYMGMLRKRTTWFHFESNSLATALKLNCVATKAIKKMLHECAATTGGD